MNSPQITWYAKTTATDYESGQEFFAGTYTGKETLAINIQIWKYRWGTTDVDTIKNAALNFYFDTLEDSALLGSCSVLIGEYDQMPVVIKNGRATVAMNRLLSGAKNNGDAANINNKNNFVDVYFEFDAADKNLKSSDMKNVYFEVVSLD